MGNNAKIGGILTIVSGAFGVLFGAAYALLIWFFNFFITSLPQTPMDPEFPLPVIQLLGLIYGSIGAFLALVGILAVVGGIYALLRKHWGLALAGAIAGNLVFPFCGIPGLIFISLGKDEFS